MMNCFFSVSRYVSLPIFCEWIDVKDLCVFDSAMCNQSNRNLFLNLIQDENVKFEGLLECSCVENYFLWLVARGLRIKQLNVQKTVLKSVQIDCVSCLTELKILKVNEDSHRYRPGFIVMIEKCTNLLELHLSDCRLLNDEIVCAIGKYCRNLTKVYFPCNTKAQNFVTDNSMIFMAESCISLQSVYLASFLNLTDVSILAFVNNCPDLVDLAIIDMQYLTDNVLLRVAEKLPALSSLDISDCIGFTGVGLDAVIVGCKQLQHIFIDYTPVAQYCKHSQQMNIDWDSMGKLTQLASLSVQAHQGLRESDFKLIAELCNKPISQLRKLTVTNCVHTTDLIALSSLCSIVNLNVSLNYCIGDLFLARLAESNKCLRVLDVSATNVTFEGLLAFIEAHSFLSELCLRQMRKFYMNDDVIAGVLRHCTQLRVLDVSFNRLCKNKAGFIGRINQMITLSAVTPDASLRKLVMEMYPGKCSSIRIAEVDFKRVQSIAALEFVCNNVCFV